MGQNHKLLFGGPNYTSTPKISPSTCIEKFGTSNIDHLSFYLAIQYLLTSDFVQIFNLFYRFFF